MQRPTLILASALLGATQLAGAQSAKPQTKAAKPVQQVAKLTKLAPKPKATAVVAVKAKPLTNYVNRGLEWLENHQLKGGAWGQGDEAEGMRGAGGASSETPSVADTCLAALAMMRSGSTPAGGEYSKSVTNALKYVCAEIEEADKESLFITNTRNTRIQGKLGQYIDTFLASQFLAEVKGSCGAPALEERVKKAFHKVMDKIERHQSKDGTWEKNGWAPVISQSVAAKAINRGAQKGLNVPSSTIARVENGARAALDTSKMVASAPVGAAGGFAGRGSGIDVTTKSSGLSRTSSIAGGSGFSGGGMGGGSAGVPLYYYSANLGALQESVNTFRQRESGLKKQAAQGKTEKDRAQARDGLKTMHAARTDLAKAQGEIVRKLDDKQFLAGFGSNGGEEFISYMNLGESLVTRGDEEWRKWDKWVTSNLNRIQNQDGSWTGHHCITGRVSCTAAALLTLMVDRSQPGLAKAVAHR